ncbi:hypothetical protein SDC9_154703 [bioreactor metagenome]|uniref:Uncharacterized protein n=1 Tax=bioreactor metagenome TaxID=1076179 RepID=A0A645F4E3_9ZZZZ
MDDLVLQMGKRMVGIYDLRRENGFYCGLKIAADKFPFAVPQFPIGKLCDAMKPELLLHLGKKLLIFPVERPHGGVDSIQLFPGVHTGAGIHRGIPGLQQIEETSHPDHKKLVQILGEDRKEFQPFQEGDLLLHGLVQHPVVEAEPGELPVLGKAKRTLFRRHPKHLVPPAGGKDSPPGRRGGW